MLVVNTHSTCFDVYAGHPPPVFLFSSLVYHRLCSPTLRREPRPANQEWRRRQTEGRRGQARRTREAGPPLVVISNPSACQGFKPLPRRFPAPLPPGTEGEGGGGVGGGCCSGDIESESSSIHSSSSALPPFHWRVPGGGCSPRRLRRTAGSGLWPWLQPGAPARLQIAHGAFTHAGAGATAFHRLQTAAETHTNATALLQASGEHTHAHLGM